MMEELSSVYLLCPWSPLDEDRWYPITRVQVVPYCPGTSGTLSPGTDGTLSPGYRWYPIARVRVVPYGEYGWYPIARELTRTRHRFPQEPPIPWIF